MKKNLVFVLLLGVSILIPQNGVAQKTSDLFMSKSFKKALTNETRSLTGKPGTAYWQNYTNYRIQAVFNPEERTISGSEVIQYLNNSPDTLKVLYFDLNQDIYKKGVARDWDIGQVDLHDGVKIRTIKIDGENINPDSTKLVTHNSTKMRVKLPEAFVPGSEHKIEVSWKAVLPETINIRMGTYNKTNFMVAYWYPKIAVYDDLYKWASLPHTGNCEFYNEFGDFEVEIKAPKGFMIWSTGVLQNEEEVFNESIRKRIAEARESEQVIHITTASDIEEGKVLIKNDSLLWKFKADMVPDFAFAVSDNYIWDATSTISGKKRMFINAVYKTTSPDFQTVADVARKSIDFYINECPKIDFPYPQITIFNGAGGMEFPGMVNDGDSRSYTGTLSVTSHEIGHSYFPFSTGLNEQLYAWMDEGLITFFPRKVVAKYTDDSTYVFFADIIKSYNRYAGSLMEIPLMIPSTNTGFAYRYHAYSRPSVAFYILSQYLGEEIFDRGLQEFTHRWKQKHPAPFDFFNTFNEVAGEDLAWFWEPWFFELGYADLGIDVSKSGDVTIKNKGGFPVPIHLKATFKDGTTRLYDEPASVWKEGKKSFNINIDNDFVKLELDTKLTPDAFVNDNIWEK